MATSKSIRYSTIGRWRSHISETVFVSALLLVLICFYFWRVIFGGYALVSTDLIFQFPFFQDAAPMGYQHASNALISDPVLQFYPWYTVTREALNSGYFPFWNPYMYAGAPHFANGQSAVLYPINVLGYLLPLNQALALSAVLRFFIAGLGMFLFVRAISGGVVGSLMAAITFMFSGSMVVWLNYPIGNAYAWMPLLFFCGERMLAARSLLYSTLGSLVIATQFLGGHYQTSFMMLLAWGIYCLYRQSDNLRDRTRWRLAMVPLLLLVFSTLLGVMLAAVQLLPFSEWLQQGNEVQLRAQERSVSLFYGGFWKDVVDLVVFVLPQVFGNPTWGSALNFFHSNYIEQAGYIGIAPLAMAGVGILSNQRAKNVQMAASESSAEQILSPRITLFLAVLGVFFLGLAVRLPGLDLINQLPIFNVVAYPRYRLIYTFCAAVLAGAGIEYILHSARNDRIIGHLLRVLTLFIVASTLLLISISIIIVYFKDQIIAYNRVAVLYPVLVSAFSLSNMSMYFPIVVALCIIILLLLYRRSNLSRQVVAISLLAISVIDLFVFGMSFNPVIHEQDIFPRTTAIDMMQSGRAESGGRIVGMYDVMPASVGTPYRLPDISGNDFPLKRYTEFAEFMGGAQLNHFRISFPALQSNLINLINVRYIIASSKPAGVPDKQLREVYHTPTVTIYENMTILPRAFVVHQATVLSDNDAIRRALLSPTFDPRKQIIIEEPPPFELPNNTPSASEPAHIIQDWPQNLQVQTNLAENGFLFLSDVYYPGWHALVDGKEAKIYRADYTFRAIYLPKGAHTIEFSYIPTGFPLGLGMSVTGLVITLASLAISWKKRRR